MIFSREHPLRVRGGRTLHTRTAIFGDNQQTAAMVYAEPATRTANLRIQYGCLYGTTLHSADCDCGLQLRGALQLISDKGGVLIYFRDHEAYGLGLFEKSQLVSREFESAETQANLISNLLDYPLRHSVLVFAVEMLNELGVDQVDTLLGSSREKKDELEKLGLIIGRTEPIPIELAEVSEFGSRDLAARYRS